MEWLKVLRDALHADFGREQPRIAMLATVDRAGAPHARAVTCRRIDDDGRLFAVSDSRSEKGVHVRGDERVELVFWLAHQRAQFRVAGAMHVISVGQDEQLRRELWRELSDATRSMFFWPTPGIAMASDDEYPQAVSADVSPPTTFEVLILTPQQVERLLTATHPHRRRRWRADSNWSGVDVNP